MRTSVRPFLRTDTKALVVAANSSRHIALMGLEITGFTKPNLKRLWVDPYEYQGELEDAVEYLAIRAKSVLFLDAGR